MLPQFRPLTLFLLAISLSLAMGSAQEEEPLVFRGGTTLVEFTMIALDSKGKPVVDLKAEEIIVSERDQPRQIAFFHFEGGKQETAAFKLPAGTFSNRPATGPGPPRNVTAILLDTLNTAPQDQIFARAQTMKYLKTLAPDTRVAVYMLGNNLNVIHDFTHDPESLSQSVARAETRLAMQASQDVDPLDLEAQLQIASLPVSLADELNDGSLDMPGSFNNIEIELIANQAADDRRARKTLAALELLGDHLAGIPGRKSLAWVTGGIPIVSTTGAMGNGARGDMTSRESALQATGRRLATQGVAVYAVDARGLLGSGDVNGLSATRQIIGRATPGRDSMSRYQESARLSSDPLPALEKLAGITGGRAFFNTNEITVAAKAAAEDLEGSYTLGFYSVDEPDGEWHEVDVRVVRKGVRLHRRKGYVAESPADALQPWTQLQWRAAVVSPVGATSFAIDASAVLSPRTDVRELTLIVQFDRDTPRYQTAADGSRQAFIELALVEKHADGAFGIQMYPLELSYSAEDAALPYQFRHSWTLRPEAISVRVIVHDQLTGQNGTLDVPVRDLPRLPEQVD